MLAENDILTLLRVLFGGTGFIHPYLRLDVGRRGRGLFTTGPIPDGDVLVQVPLQWVLRRGNLAWSEALGFREDIAGLDEDEQLIVFLAVLRKYGLYSKWYSYARTLPMEEPNSTMTWDSAEIAALLGTSAHAQARSLRKQLLRLCSRLSGSFDCFELRWAASHYWSRALAVSGLPGITSGSVRALLPAVDLINFDAESKNYFHLAGDTIVYIAGSDYFTGDEICDNYGGAKTDAFLLTHYGFLHDNESASYVSLTPPVANDRHRRLKRRILATLPPSERMLKVRGADVEMVGLLRLGLMPPEELSAFNVHALLGRVPLRVADMRRTEGRAMRWLVDKCRDELDKLRRHDALSRVSCHGPVAALITMYLERNARLWHNCVASVEERLGVLDSMPSHPFPLSIRVDGSSSAREVPASPRQHWEDDKASTAAPEQSTATGSEFIPSGLPVAADRALFVRLSSGQLHGRADSARMPAVLSIPVKQRRARREAARLAAEVVRWKVLSPSWLQGLASAALASPTSLGPAELAASLGALRLSAAAVSSPATVRRLQSRRRGAWACGGTMVATRQGCGIDDSFAWLSGLPQPAARSALARLPGELQALRPLLIGLGVDTRRFCGY